VENEEFPMKALPHSARRPRNKEFKRGTLMHYMWLWIEVFLKEELLQSASMSGNGEFPK
jgi:hypothetical protein